MRIIKKYRFQIGTKIPYYEWPEIIHRFLEDKKLTSRHFLYYFEDILSRDETPENKFANCGCTRILKDCPLLGDIRLHYDEKHSRSYKLWLSNIDRNDFFPENAILPLMKKIHLRYGFCESVLFYFDIDFFGKSIPFERDYSAARQMCSIDKTEFDPTMYMECQPYGSGIVLHRDACADNYIEMSVDLLHDGEVLDAAQYYESLKVLLPNTKVSTSLKIYLTDEEQQNIAAINQAAAPVLEKCRSFFMERTPYTVSQNHFPSNYSIAIPLRKLAKQHGYTYQRIHDGVFSLEKRTARGNVLFITVYSGPSHYDLSAGLSYQGVGFLHDLSVSRQCPISQQEADDFLARFLNTAAEFENVLLPSLDILFPETPSWFMPSEL